MELVKEQVRLFFQTARERQMILLRRQAGWSRELWTSDPIMRKHHFCNVFRCDDRVSRAILDMAKAWEDPWRATLAGRLVNRYDTIRWLVNLEHECEPEDLRLAIARFGLNTNAYRLNTPLGLNSAEGVVMMYDLGRGLGGEILSSSDVGAALDCMGQVGSLGIFLRYQILLDLLELKAFPASFQDDRAYPGMGAGRGASRMLGIPISPDWKIRRNRELLPAGLAEEVMSSLLEFSRDPWNWPPAWRPWTIHEAEGWLCEYDKWARYTNGESDGGRRFKGPYAEKNAQG